MKVWVKTKEGWKRERWESKKQCGKETETWNRVKKSERKCKLKKERKEVKKESERDWERERSGREKDRDQCEMRVIESVKKD